MTKFSPSVPEIADRPFPALWKLAIPALLEQFLVFCIGMFDTWLAGRIGTEASAAVGLASYVDWLATLMFSAAGVGTAAMVSRHWGAGEYEQGKRAASQAVPLAVLTGLTSGAIIFIGAPFFARIQGLHRMSEATYAIGVNFLQISATSHVCSAIILAGNAALRGSGDMRSPMLILAAMNVVNAGVSAGLVFGWVLAPLGTNGIVLGTVAARVIGAIVMCVWMLRSRRGIGWIRSWLAPRMDWLQRMLRIGLPALADGLLTWVGHFLFIMVVAHLGEGSQGRAYYAAHMVGITIEALTYLPAVAWGTAAASLIGQSLGAGNPVRAWWIGHRAVLQCSVAAAGAAFFYYFEADLIFSWMHTDPEVRAIGAPALRYLSLYQIPLVILIVYTHALRGAGDTRSPMIFTILGTLMVRVPVAYFCGIVLHGGLIGAWTGMMVDVCFRAILASVRYFRGGWTKISV